MDDRRLDARRVRDRRRVQGIGHVSINSRAAGVEWGEKNSPFRAYVTAQAGLLVEEIGKNRHHIAARVVGRLHLADRGRRRLIRKPRAREHAANRECQDDGDPVFRESAPDDSSHTSCIGNSRSDTPEPRPALVRHGRFGCRASFMTRAARAGLWPNLGVVGDTACEAPVATGYRTEKKVGRIRILGRRPSRRFLRRTDEGANCRLRSRAVASVDCTIRNALSSNRIVPHLRGLASLQ